MVSIIKDDRFWNVQIIVQNDKCPFLFYPNNIHACSYKDYINKNEFMECTLENCPLKYL